jgi:hypothetical protein
VPAASPTRFATPPVRLLTLKYNTSSEAIPVQAPGSCPLRVLLNKLHVRSLVRAAQEGGNVPAGQTPCLWTTRVVHQHLVGSRLQVRWVWAQLHAPTVPTQKQQSSNATSSRSCGSCGCQAPRSFAKKGTGPCCQPPAPPVRTLVCNPSSTSAAIPDKAPGSGPLRVLRHSWHTLSLVRAPQEGGKVPAETHITPVL